MDNDFDWQHDYLDIEYTIDNWVLFDRDKIHHYDRHMMERNHTNFSQHHNLRDNDLNNINKMFNERNFSGEFSFTFT